MTFQEYIVAVTKEYHDGTRGWRHGQTAYNLLAQHNEALAFKVHGTVRDPFYNDTVLADFYDYVGRNWG